MFCIPVAWFQMFITVYVQTHQLATVFIQRPCAWQASVDKQVASVLQRHQFSTTHIPQLPLLPALSSTSLRCCDPANTFCAYKHAHKNDYVFVVMVWFERLLLC
jgi:hypothetical protein